MRFATCLITVALLAGCSSDKKSVFRRVRKSIFKIQIVAQTSKFLLPWKYNGVVSASGTGFYIGDERILTNAHVVANAKYITVLRDGDATPTPAYVQYISHESDLAILAVKEKNFFDSVRPLVFGEMPKLLTPVATIGYPKGGERLSITEGVVSRVGYQLYGHSGSRKHLLVQVDAAINPGNSGGPVMQGNKVAGVAFQGYRQIENTGYIIPPSVVRHFLDDIEDKKRDGHPTIGMGLMEGALNNPAARAYYGLKGERGIVVSFVTSYSPMYKTLEKSDILLKIDDYDIGTDGTVEFKGERVDFQAIYDLKQINENITFTILRAGEEKVVTTKIAAAQPYPFPENWYAEKPRYLVYSGLVFTALTINYLKTWGGKWYMNAPFFLRYVFYHFPFYEQYQNNREFVVLSARLPHAINAYVSSQQHAVVKMVDNKPVYRIEDMAKYFSESEGEFIRIDFHADVEPIVLPREQAQQVNEEINRRYGVHPDRWFKSGENDGAIAVGDAL